MDFTKMIKLPGKSSSSSNKTLGQKPAMKISNEQLLGLIVIIVGVVLIGIAILTW